MLIAELLTPRTGTEAGSSLFFKDAAQGFLRALLMHVVTTYPASQQHLGTIYALVNASPDEWEALLEAMQDNDAGDKLIARVANALARSEQQAPEEFSAVMSTIQQDASWLADPIVRENLKRSDVDFSVLKGVTRDGRSVTGGIIFVILPLEYAQSHAAISRLAMGCAIGYLCLFTWEALTTLLRTIPAFALSTTDKLLCAAASASRYQWRLLTGRIRTGVSIRTAPPVCHEPEPARIIPVINDWESACALLGLSPGGFSDQELTRAYRIAMRAAHPDQGGHPEMAKAFNIARDLIRAAQSRTLGA